MKAFAEHLSRAEARVAGTFLVLMVALIFGGGIARLFGSPMNWTTDAATCLFAWACFLCADIAWRRRKLMSVELLTARLSERHQRVLRLVNYALIAAFLIYLIGAGTWLSYVSRARSFQGIPQVSYSWITMSLPVGALLLLVTTVRRIREELDALAGREPHPAPAGD